MRDILEGISELDADLDDLLTNARPSAAPTLEPIPKEPIGFVKRQLTGPDGSQVEVEVPVYAASDPLTEPASATDEALDSEADVELQDLDEPLKRLDPVIALAGK